MPDFSSPPTPFQPPRLSRNEAKARTTIAQRGSDLLFRLGDIAWRADLRPAIAEPMEADSWMLSFEWVGAEFYLQLPHAAAEEVASSLLPEASLTEMPHELASAVLEAGLTDALSGLKSLGRGTPQWLGMEQNAVAPAHSAHAFDVYLRTKDTSAAITAQLHTDSLGLLLIAGLVGKRARAPGVLENSLILKLPAEIGYSHLPSQELASLERGDVVLMERCHIGAERMLWLTADGAAGLHVRLPSLAEADSPAPASSQPAEGWNLPESDFSGSIFSGSDFSESDAPATDIEPLSPATPQLIVIQAWSSAMPAETPFIADAPSLDGLPVRLSFDLGDITLTLAEVRALQPGQAISLTRPLSGAVRIRANGAQVGEGDLVEIDGQMGVSIRTLFASSQQEV